MADMKTKSTTPGIELLGSCESFPYPERVDGGFFKSLNWLYAREPSKKDIDNRIIPEYDSSTELYGYKDIFGRWIIEPTYTKAASFIDTSAFVCENDKNNPYPDLHRWIIIDINNNNLWKNYTFYEAFPYGKDQCAFLLYGTCFRNNVEGIWHNKYDYALDTRNWEMYLFMNGRIHDMDHVVPVGKLFKGEDGAIYKNNAARLLIKRVYEDCIPEVNYACLKEDGICMNYFGKCDTVYLEITKEEVEFTRPENLFQGYQGDDDSYECNAFRNGVFLKDGNRWRVFFTGHIWITKPWDEVHYYYEQNLIEAKKKNIFGKEEYYYWNTTSDIFEFKKGPKRDLSMYRIYNPAKHGADKIQNNFESDLFDSEKYSICRYYTDGYFIKEQRSKDHSDPYYMILNHEGKPVSDTKWKSIDRFHNRYFKNEKDLSLFTNNLLLATTRDNQVQIINKSGIVVFDNLSDAVLTEQYIVTERLRRNVLVIEYHLYNELTKVYDWDKTEYIDESWEKVKWYGTKLIIRNESGVLYYMDIKESESIRRIQGDILTLDKNPALTYFIGYDRQKNCLVFDNDLKICDGIDRESMEVLGAAAREEGNIWMAKGYTYIEYEGNVYRYSGQEV